MSSAFLDYFRCPQDLVDLSTVGEPSQSDGFFTFDETTCFGRPTGACPAREVAGAPDVTDRVTRGGGGLRLPFDLSEVVANLRHERYHSKGNGLTSSALARKVYYGLRPLFSVSVRKHLQKIGLGGWEDIPFPQWPVDVSVDRLMRSVLGLALRSRGGRPPIPFIWFWPEGAQSCAMVTHDVEDEAGRDYCSALMDRDDEFGIRSAFQVVPEGRYDGVLQLVDSIRARGFEVNVHDLNHDGALFQNKQKFWKRAEKINDYARQFQSRGFRAGVMYREQAWYDAFDFSFDMSVPNVAHLEPQRGGCCTVMPYFIGKILELPLTTTQDYSLFHVLGDYSTDLWAEQMRRIMKENGLISFIIHPDYLVEDRARAVYLELLSSLARLRASSQLWLASPSEIDRWWRSRHQMKLVPTGDSWKIEGPSSDRARVAYASLEDGVCVYTLDSPTVTQNLSASTTQP